MRITYNIKIRSCSSGIACWFFNKLKCQDQICDVSDLIEYVRGQEKIIRESDIADVSSRLDELEIRKEILLTKNPDKWFASLLSFAAFVISIIALLVAYQGASISLPDKINCTDAIFFNMEMSSEYVAYLLKGSILLVAIIFAAILINIIIWKRKWYALENWKLDRLLCCAREFLNNGDTKSH